MKYEAPIYSLIVVNTEDILASSEKYEIKDNNDGSGNVIMTAFDLFN